MKSHHMGRRRGSRRGSQVLGSIQLHILSGCHFTTSNSRPTSSTLTTLIANPQEFHAESTKWSYAKLGRATKGLSHLPLSQVTTPFRSPFHCPKYKATKNNTTLASKQPIPNSRSQINLRSPPVPFKRERHCRSRTSFARNGFGEA
jgi:hypothetical protein